ncbi:hypothetical protein B0H15DRAFT_932622 [Mycena belliarum]|uniref:Uncharacterized protein n=1 Tax=Mycena belliarum TaxID=1033014 RepID=A0AAD6TX40_9AGAR|nr:hypothetical protein B0H15DRAFT_932622 [Mycena belliae]
MSSPRRSGAARSSTTGPGQSLTSASRGAVQLSLQSYLDVHRSRSSKLQVHLHITPRLPPAMNYTDGHGGGRRIRVTPPLLITRGSHLLITRRSSFKLQASSIISPVPYHAPRLSVMACVQTYGAHQLPPTPPLHLISTTSATPARPVPPPPSPRSAPRSAPRSSPFLSSSPPLSAPPSSPGRAGRAGGGRARRSPRRPRVWRRGGRGRWGLRRGRGTPTQKTKPGRGIWRVTRRAGARLRRRGRVSTTMGTGMRGSATATTPT